MGFVDSEQQLHEQAIEQAGSDYFGDSAYLEGFRVLLDACDKESKLNDLGRQNTMEKLQQLLAHTNEHLDYTLAAFDSAIDELVAQA